LIFRYGSGLAGYFTGSRNYSQNGNLSDFYSLSGSPSRTNLLSLGGRGKKSFVTIDTVNKATDPKQKIAYAGQVAATLKLSADAATSLSNPVRVVDITNQTKQLMNAISDAVNQLKTTDGSVKEGAEDPKVKLCQDRFAPP
jgi:hypothetical protein